MTGPEPGETPPRARQSSGAPAGAYSSTAHRGNRRRPVLWLLFAGLVLVVVAVVLIAVLSSGKSRHPTPARPATTSQALPAPTGVA